MAETTDGFKFFQAEVIGVKMTGVKMTGVKGEREAGHVKGQKIKLSCWGSGGLCRFFYHDIFPSLQTMQFGANLPWSPDGVLTLECPDRHNAVTIGLSRL